MAPNSRTLHIFLFLVCIAFSSQAQIEVKNKILDFATGLPLENASVYVQNTTIGTVSNVDGKFVLLVPSKHAKDTLVVSTIGYKSYKVPVDVANDEGEIYLEEDVASLDEVVIVADPRPQTGNEVVLRALEKLQENMPDSAYIQKGFLRHKERNTKEFKWLIESAISLYDSGFASPTNQYLKVNVDEMRKSYDLRDVDSLFTYYTYLKNTTGNKTLKAENLKRDTIPTSRLAKAIKWNDTRVNGLPNLFKGKLNLLRNTQEEGALFGDDILNKHLFSVDTVLVDNGRKIYKIQIAKGKTYVGLNTEGIYNEGYHPRGWIYIYWDNYAIKKIEYELVAASPAQKSRSKTLFGTQTNHKLIINYMAYNDKMYPSYIYYETPKLVNVGYKPKGKMTKEAEARYNKEERYYFTVQEILFSEIIEDKAAIAKALSQKWEADIFSPKPYNKAFWKNYNVLLESEEDEKLIQDLTKRSKLFKE